jgi:hypothetical protein
MSISIRDHGALPTPGLDNTAFIQAAINAAATSTQTRTVVVPPGVFETSRVTVPTGVKMVWDGGTLKHRVMTTTEACVEIVGADVILRDALVDGNRANQTVKGYGILVQGDRAHLDNVTVTNTTGTGVLISGRYGHRLAWVKVRDTGENGIGFTKPTSLVDARDFAIHGAMIERTNDGGIGVMGQNFAVLGSTTRDTGGDGITAYADENGQYAIVGNALDSIGNNGVHSAGSNAVVAGNAIRNATSRGIYHETQGQLLEDTVVLSSNAITGTGLSGIEAWPCLSLAVVANAVTGARGEAAVDIRRTDALALVGNVAGTASGCGYLIRATRHATVTGNAGTGLIGDLIRVADGGLSPSSLNGIIAANVGNSSAKAVNMLDGAAWWTELATMPGVTAADPYIMGGATNRRMNQ